MQNLIVSRLPRLAPVVPTAYMPGMTLVSGSTRFEPRARTPDSAAPNLGDLERELANGEINEYKYVDMTNHLTYLAGASWLLTPRARECLTLGTYRLRYREGKSLQQVWSVITKNSPSPTGEILVELCGKRKGTKWAKTASINVNPITKADVGQTVFVLYAAHSQYDIGILRDIGGDMRCTVKFPGENGTVKNIDSKFLVVYNLRD